MRQIDRWVGIPVCSGLTLLRRLGDLLRRLRKRRSAPVRRILFVKLAEQGATVLAYPSIRRAVEMVGPDNVFFLVFEENRFILDVMDVIPRQNVLTIPTTGFPALAGGAIRAVRRLRKAKVDAAIDFEFFARSSAVLTYLSGAGLRVGLHRFGDGAPYRGDLMTHRLLYNPNIHTSELYAGMVEAINGSPTGPMELPGVPGLGENERPVFNPCPEELAEVEAVVRDQARASSFSPLVLFNANASDLLPLRRWPSASYVELAKRLIERIPGVFVAFTGAPDEAAIAERLVAEVGSDRCFSMAGKTTLRQLLVLYCLADVLVTNDSGPALFATLTPAHVITLFGPETPARFGSRAPKAHVVWKNLSCSPCVNAYNNRHSTCKDNQCMQKITVEEVFGKVKELLAKE